MNKLDEESKNQEKKFSAYANYNSPGRSGRDTNNSQSYSKPQAEKKEQRNEREKELHNNKKSKNDFLGKKREYAKNESKGSNIINNKNEKELSIKNLENVNKEKIVEETMKNRIHMGIIFII